MVDTAAAVGKVALNSGPHPLRAVGLVSSVVLPVAGPVELRSCVVQAKRPDIWASGSARAGPPLHLSGPLGPSS